jgi:hypothetical protein
VTLIPHSSLTSRGTNNFKITFAISLMPAFFYDQQHIHPIKVLWGIYEPPAVITSNCEFCIRGSCVIFSATAIISLNSVNELIFVMVKCRAFFAVRTEFLNIV